MASHADRHGRLEVCSPRVRKMCGQGEVWSIWYLVFRTAADGGHLATVKVLMQRGARLHALDDGGCSAAEVATEAGHAQVAQWLATYAATSAALAARVEERPGRSPSPPPRPRPPRAPHACAHCGATEWAASAAEGEGARLRKCGGCRRGARARYCSAACQERHWKAEHREQCSRVPR